MNKLPRYLALWSDGVTRVIHAPTWAQADALARRLEVPTGVWLRSIAAVPS